MKKEISVDLTIGRKDSGLSEKDVAHLLGVGKSRISKLQNSKARLTVREVCALCLIYGRSVEHLFRLSTRTVATSVKKRLSTIPKEPHNWERKRDQRKDTMNGLHERLRQLNKEGDE